MSLSLRVRGSQTGLKDWPCRIGSRPAEIGDDLQDLEDIGLLKRRQMHGSEVTRYDPKRAATVRNVRGAK